MSNGAGGVTMAYTRPIPLTAAASDLITTNPEDGARNTRTHPGCLIPGAGATLSPQTDPFKGPRIGT